MAAKPRRCVVSVMVVGHRCGGVAVQVRTERRGYVSGVAADRLVKAGGLCGAGVLGQRLGGLAGGASIKKMYATTVAQRRYPAKI
jgi:hypothetical protein